MSQKIEIAFAGNHYTHTEDPAWMAVSSPIKVTNHGSEPARLRAAEFTLLSLDEEPVCTGQVAPDLTLAAGDEAMLTVALRCPASVVREGMSLCKGSVAYEQGGEQLTRSAVGMVSILP
ncbi:MAG: hypothetical protein ABIO70_25030 [Pseudomonadota bacterium]